MAKKPPSKRKNAEDVLDILLESSESGPMLGATSGSNEEMFKRLGVPKGRQTERFAEILRGAAWEQSGTHAPSPVNRYPVPEDFVGPPAPYEYRGDELDEKYRRRGSVEQEPLFGPKYVAPSYYVPGEEWGRTYGGRPSPSYGDASVPQELLRRVKGVTPYDEIPWPRRLLNLGHRYPMSHQVAEDIPFDTPYAEPSVQGRAQDSNAGVYSDWRVAPSLYGPEGEAAHKLLRDYVKKKKK